MKKLIIFLSFMLFVCCSKSTEPSGELQRENIILNGTFQDSLNYWGIRGNPSINEEIYLVQKKSLLINTTYESYTYLYQNLSYPVKEIEADIWVYPASEEYEQMIQFLSDWPGDNILFLVSIGFRTESISCRSLDSLIIIPDVLDFNTWNHISVKTGLKARINVYVNDKLKFTFDNSEPIPIETIMLGDVSRNKNYGKVYYDAVSVYTTELDTLNNSN